MPSARRKSLQKQLSSSSTKQRVITKSPSLSERVSPLELKGYCHLSDRNRAQSTKSRRVEYIKLAQKSTPRLTAQEMSLGFKDKHVLIGQVEEYNRRIQLPTFHIKGNFTSDDDVEYEGCLRFFLAHADNNFTKAVRVTSSTTWKSLKPTLLEKFNLIEGVESGKLVPILYAVKESGESSVRDEDCPLVLALMASVHIQFVLKVYQEGKDPASPVEDKHKLSQSNSFFSAMKKKINKTKSKDKLVANQQCTSSSSKVAEPVGPAPHKHGRQKSDSTGSIGSRKKSDASSKKSSASIAANNLGSAVHARSMENLSKAGKTVKKKKAGRGNNSQSNMLAIDDTEEFITIHGDRSELGVDEVVVPIDGGITVRDLIADVLEECEISLARVDDYCLCDVIGRECEGLWLTDYARDMNDSEKPLLLISMMKPSEGLARRFEIKNIAKEDETGSHGTSNHEDQLLPFEIRDFNRDASNSLSSISTSNATDYNNHTLKFPTDVPYFLTIQSFDPQHDSVLHPVCRTTSIIGSSEDEDKCNIRLFAPDIQPQHCWVCKVYDDENEAEYKCISLAPFPRAEMRINDEEITQKTNIKAGDIITLGQHYIFLFKDPTTDSKPESGSQSMVRQTMSGGSEEHVSKPLYGENRQWHDLISHAMSLSFTLEKQDELLSKIFSIMKSKDEGYKITPAYLLALALDHSRQTMRTDQLATFLNKISSEFQNTILENTKHLQSSTLDMDSSSPVECLNTVSPHLQCLLFWMANCIELRGYLSMNQASFSVAVGSTDIMDEAMNVLSDSVIYAFQQAVYHLTKVLYPTLELILTDNPFSRMPNEAPTMNDTLKSLSMIQDIANEMSLNIAITQQLFSYLYFFIGTSLCNKMFEQDSVSLYYNWEEGVKIRKNIELLENWSHDVNMEAANNYLSKVISVADFLATSKQFLLQASWHQLRNLYPLIGAAQLRHLLDNYDLGNRQVPAQWCPPSDEIYKIMEEGVMESFDDHPPLVIPSHSIINLSVRVEDKIFNQHLDYLNATYGHHQSEDETDSGFDLGHSRSPTEVDDNSKSFGEHAKLGSRGSNNSHASEKSGKSYTPIFKKKRQTPPPKRASAENKIMSGNEYNNTLISSRHGGDSSDEELSSQMDRISVHSKHSSSDTFTNKI